MMSLNIPSHSQIELLSTELLVAALPVPAKGHMASTHRQEPLVLAKVFKPVLILLSALNREFYTQNLSLTPDERNDRAPEF